MEIPDDSRFKTIASIGIPVVSGAIANFPVISVSRKKIVLDGEKLTWEMRMKDIPVFFKGGDYDGKTGVFNAEKEIDIYTLRGGKIRLPVEGFGEAVFPILDVSTNGLLLDASSLVKK